MKVDVVLADGQCYALRGRVARLVAWLCRHAQDVERMTKGELVFAFSGRTLTGRVSEVFDPLDGA